MSEVVPLNKNGRYTDFRVLIRDMQEKHPDAKRGIIILFDEDNSMLIHHICTSSLLAFAGADLLHCSVVLTESDTK